MDKPRIEYFNDEELSLIADALISAIDNCNKASALVIEESTKDEIQKESKRLSKLLNRVCNLNRVLYGEV